MAYPVFQSVSTAAASHSVGVQSATISSFSGLAVGDLLLATATSHSAAITAPSGWTIIKADSGSNTFITSYYKVAVSGDLGATFAWSITVSAGEESLIVAAARVTGADTTNPIGYTSFNFFNGSATTAPTSPGFTTTKQPLLVALIGSVRLDTSSSTVSGYAIANTNPSWTAVASSQGGDANADVSTTVAMGWAKQTTTGATGAASATFSTAQPSYSYTLVGVQAPVLSPQAFATFSIFGFTVNTQYVAAIFGSVFSLFTPTITTHSSWTRVIRSISTWITQTKD